MQLQQDLAAAQGGGGATARTSPRIDQQIAQADRVFQGTQGGDGGCRLLRELLHFRPRPGAEPEMPQHERPRRGRAAPAHPAPAAAPGAHGRRRQQAAAGRASGCARPQRLRRSGPAAAPRRRFIRFFRRRREEEEQLPQTPVYRSIDPNGRYRTGLREAVRRLLLSDPLLDLWQHARARTPKHASRIARRPPSFTSIAIPGRRSSRRCR